MPDDAQALPPLPSPMARHHPVSLLDLRGHFFAQALDPMPRQAQDRHFIREAYPVTDEHAILISSSKAALMQVPRQDILWTITYPTDAISALALSLPHQLLALASTWGQVFLWDLRTGQFLWTFELDGNPAQLALSADGSTLVAGLYGTGVQLWNLAERSLLHTLWGPNDTNAYHSVACSPDGKWIASGNYEGDDVYVWRLADGQLIHDLQEPGGRVAGLAFSPDGRLLVCGDDGSRAGVELPMRVWEMPGGQVVQRFPWHAMDPTFSPSGQLLAAVGRAGLRNYSGVIFLGEVASRRESHRLIGHTGEVMHLAFSPSGRGLLSCGADGTVRWWDVPSGREVYRLEAFVF